MSNGPHTYRSIPGWLTDNEARCLYDVARKTRGNLLEVGTFLGRSTSVLCEGIRDAGQVGRKFVSYDLSCSSLGEFKTIVNAIGQEDFFVPALLSDLWARGANSTDEARKYLEEHELLQYVELRKGDFRADNATYDTMFLDVMHGPEEMSANLPHVYRLSRPMTLVAIHDMHEETTLPEIRRQAHGKLHFFRLVDTLGLFQRL